MRTWLRDGLIGSILFIILSSILFFAFELSRIEFLGISLLLLLAAGMIMLGLYGLFVGGLLSVGNPGISNSATWSIVVLISLVFWFLIGVVVGKIYERVHKKK